MQQVDIEARVRQASGKEKNRKLRNHGEVPAVLYGRGVEATMLAVKEKDIRKALSTSSGQNVLVNLTVVNGTTRKVSAMIQEVQNDVFAKVLHHIDFHQIDVTESVHANVKIVTKGPAKGEKDGGSVDHVLWELPVEGSVTAIPNELEVDITKLGMGQSIHVRDLKLPEGVTTRHNPDDIVVVVHPPRAEAPAEAAPAAVAEPAAAPAAKGKPEA